MDVKNLGYKINSLSIYKPYDDYEYTPLFRCFRDMITALDGELLQAMEKYTSFCNMLFESEFLGNLGDFFYNYTIYHKNVFSLACFKENTLPEPISAAAHSDIAILSKLSTLTTREIKAQLKNSNFDIFDTMIDELPNLCEGNVINQNDWNINTIAAHYRTNGIGIFARYKAFIYTIENGLGGVLNPDPIRFSDLKMYDTQKDIVIQNTLHFLEKGSGNNILLYGDRGTGKSSTVKALLNEYADKGLKIVQLDKKNLSGLPKLCEILSQASFKFIIFIDDLTFGENDENFGMLKAVLEGGIIKTPENIVIYATSNRRHLVKETFTAREGSELHRADTIDETLSLSDRFGLVVSFLQPDKDEYLKIVKMLADEISLKISEEELFLGAEKFAIRQGARTPRLARQYLIYLQSSSISF